MLTDVVSANFASNSNVSGDLDVENSLFCRLLSAIPSLKRRTFVLRISVIKKLKERA